MAPAVEPSRRTKLYREGSPGERWWFSLLLFPALLTAAVVATQGSKIEDELQAEVVSALRAAGLPNTRVEMAGRKVTLFVPTGESASRAEGAADRVEGVGGVVVEKVAANAREAAACENLQAKIDRADKRGVLFAGSSTSMTPAGQAAVREIARLLVRCPTAQVVSEGHTDAKVLGGAGVSLRRAEVVRSALVKGGVKGNRVDVKGFGNTFPASRGDDPAARARNNRVLVMVAGD